MTADISYLQNLQQPLDELQALFDAQRAAYAGNPMPPAAQRQQWLKALRDLLNTERQALIDAISQDFSHRSADETLLAELMPSLHGIHYASRHLKGWMRESRRKVGVAFQPASAKVVYQPLGVVGVIVPWNYPLYLAIGPLVGALSAGNRVMLKLSESTPATGLLLKALFARIFPEDLVCVVLGEADIGVVKRLFMGVGQGFSLFVRKLGLKLIANQGPVSVQAQNNALELIARLGLDITSTEDEIRITAKKKINLNGGGSYLTLDAGGIESGTAGNHLVKAAHHEFKGPGEQALQMPPLPQLSEHLLQSQGRTDFSG